MPRVSVVLSTYNWSSVLPFSIGSVLRQNYADWELLVIGDGCSDDSSEVVAELAAKDARVRWHNLPRNTGNQAGPNNAGLRLARGELIAYLGHDDLWFPHHLQSLVDAIDAGADLAHSVVRWVCPPDEAPHSIYYAPQRLIAPSSVMHRKSVTDKVGPWREYGQFQGHPDAELWGRIRAARFQIALAPRLSVIKLPALRRRDVYQTRPSHEQAAWFARIAAEPDLETRQFTAMLCEGFNHFGNVPQGFVDDCRNVLRRVPARVKNGCRRWRGGKILTRVEAGRAFRGLDVEP